MASSSSLNVPLTSKGESATRLRTRSPKGQRGRPRKAAAAAPPPPPPTSLLKRARSSPYYYPVVVLLSLMVAGLLISAIRIASRDPIVPMTQTYRNQAVRPPRPVPAPPPIIRPDSSSSHDGTAPLRPADRASPPDVKGGIEDLTDELGEDYGRKIALGQTWDLQGVSEGDLKDEERPPSIKAEETVAGTGGSRSLQELYAELDGMGVTVDDLSQALNEAYRDSPGQPQAD